MQYSDFQIQNIAKQLQDKGATPQEIDSFVKSAKQGPTQIDPQAKGFFKGLASDILSPLTRTAVSLYDIATATPHAVRAIRDKSKGDLQGAAQEVQKGEAELRARNLPVVGETKPLTTPAEAAGEGTKAGLLFTTFGEGSTAEELALKGIKSLPVKTLMDNPNLLPTMERLLTAGKGVIPRAVEQGILGSGFAGAQKLSENKIPTPGDLAGGFAGGSALPIASTMASQAIEKLSSAAPDFASRLNNSVIKPLLKDLSYGKDPGRGVAREGITFSNLEEGAQKIDQRLGEIGSQIGQKIKAHGDTEVNFSSALAPIDKALEQAKKLPRTNQSLITRLEDLKKDLLQVKTDEAGNDTIGVNLDKMKLSDVFKFKEDVAGLTKFTGNASDDNIVNKALKQVYGQAKEILNKNIPGISDLNERYADLKSASIAIKYRDKIEQRQNLVKLTPKMIVSAGGIAAFTSAMLHNPVAAMVELGGSLGVAGIEKAMSSPTFKTTVAKWLAEAPEEDKAAVLKKAPMLKNVFNKIMQSEEVQNIRQRLTGNKAVPVSP